MNDYLHNHIDCGRIRHRPEAVFKGCGTILYNVTPVKKNARQKESEATVNQQEKKQLKSKRSIFTLYIIVFLVMFTLTSMTPMIHDDFSYSFSFYDDTRITSVAQIIPSMMVHRQILNGRVLVHALVQFFLMLPKTVFNVANALNAVLLCWLISKYLNGSSQKKTLCIASALMALWVFSPGFGQNFLWLDGAINYSWSYSVFLIFLWPYTSEYLQIGKRDSSFLRFFLYLLLAFYAGSCSEYGSLVFLVLAVCLTAVIWNRVRRVPYRLLMGLIAELGGWLFLMTAPATSGRGAELSVSVIGNNIAGLIQGTESYLFILLLINVFLLIIVEYYHGRKDIIILAILFMIGSLASLFSLVFAAYYLPRHFGCAVFLLVLAFVLLLNELLLMQQKLPAELIAGGLAVLFIFRFSLGVLDITVCWNKGKEREAAILAAVAAGESSVTVENCVPMTQYALRTHINEDNPREWPNNSIASYYGIDNVLGTEPED